MKICHFNPFQSHLPFMDAKAKAAILSSMGQASGAFGGLLGGRSFEGGSL